MTISILTTAAVRVVVVADVRMYREGLAAALRAEPGVEVLIPAARRPHDLAQLQPDVVLYDVSRPDAVQAVRELLDALHMAKVVVVGVSERECDLLAFAEAGVSGYITCEQPLQDVVPAVRAVARGETICTPRIAAALLRHVAALAAGSATPAPAPGLLLTPREREIAALIGQGMSNKQIARALQIQVATTKNHVHNILEKLGVERRGEVVAQLRRGTSRSAEAGGPRPDADPSIHVVPAPEPDRRPGRSSIV